MLVKVAVFGGDDRLPHQGRNRIFVIIQMDDRSNLLFGVQKSSAPSEGRDQLGLKIEILNFGAA